MKVEADWALQNLEGRRCRVADSGAPLKSTEPGMAVFLVSFEIRYDHTYQERYRSFVKEVQKSSPWWAESTTFIVVETNETIDELFTNMP
jgi:hypothetical protein